MKKRYGTGHRTARENIAHLCDEGSFLEYGSVVMAAQRRRRSEEDLIKNTTGDGMVCGLGHVNGHLFPEALLELWQCLMIIWFLQALKAK